MLSYKLSEIAPDEGELGAAGAIGAYVNEKLGNPAGKVWGKLDKVGDKIRSKLPFSTKNQSMQETAHSGTYQHQYEKYNSSSYGGKHSQVLSPRNMGGLSGEPHNPSAFEKIIDYAEKNVKILKIFLVFWLVFGS